MCFEVYEFEFRKEIGFDENWFDIGFGETYNSLKMSVQVSSEYLDRARGFHMWAAIPLDKNRILDITVTDQAGNRLAYGSISMKM